MNARAFLGNDQVGHVFRFNPDEVEWGYTKNIISQDTLGGRVVQLLSVKVEQMTINAKAGSRHELQRFATDMKQIMQYHVETQLPVHFRVPSRKWDFMVYAMASPQLGWAVDTVTYPFQMVLGVQEDLIGGKTAQLHTLELGRLATEIGYNDAFHGGNAEKFLEIVHSLAAFGSVQSGTTPASTGALSGGMAEKVLAAAKSQLGVPYVFATEDPTGQGDFPATDPRTREHDTAGASFDCSGLTQWCYGQAGIFIPQISYLQYDALEIHPSKDQLRPSDLVFYGEGNIGHVAIYAGNGKIIHAPHTGSFVKYESINYWSAYKGAGRSKLMTFGDPNPANSEADRVPFGTFHALPTQVLGGGWGSAPNGVLLHFTAGCGDPYQTLLDRGVSVHCAVIRDGSIVQYAPISTITNHAHEASLHYFGIETSAYPGAGCDVTLAQLTMLAKTAAYMLDWIKTTYGRDVPVQRSSGATLTKPGIKCHTDGQDPGASWDPSGHWDSPVRCEGDPSSGWVESQQRTALNRSPWSWADMLSAISGYRTT